MTLYHSDGHSAGLLNQRVDKILFALSIDKAPEGRNLNMKAMKGKKLKVLQTTEPKMHFGLPATPLLLLLSSEFNYAPFSIDFPNFSIF